MKELVSSSSKDGEAGAKEEMDQRILLNLETDPKAIWKV